jgi:hypothetical protein
MSADPSPYQPIFVVTVDTEADDAWNSPELVNLTNMKQIPRFQELCESYGAVPTYLVAYECASRDEAIRVLEPLARSMRAEIGHHLHVWTAPPFHSPSRADVDMNWLHSFQFELPSSLFEEKAESLRAKIEEVYGFSPTSHRAGRWGIDQRSINWLCKSGFTVDSSVRPLLRIAGADTPNCTLNDDENPCVWTASDDSTGGQLLEVPASIHRPYGYVADYYGRHAGRNTRWSNTLMRIYAKLGGLLPLRPDPNVSNSALSHIVNSAIRREVSVINLTLHSSELEFGCSPFSRNAKDAQAVWERLETVLSLVGTHEMSPCGLSDVPNLLTMQE